MTYTTKLCQRCGKEYQPIGPNQKRCAECRPIDKREQHHKWDKANPEKCRKHSAKYYKANREKCCKAVTKSQKANPEKVCKAAAEYYKANAEKRRKASAEWCKANPEKRVLFRAKRRSLKYANTPVDELLTLAQWHDVLTQYNGHCAYCGKKTEHLTLDHVRPLSKGGMHSKDNVVPACSHCNSSKGAHTPEERFGLGIAG